VNHGSCCICHSWCSWRVWQEVEYRLDVCRATNDAHIELR
jgi:hypothetical protein